jgi:biotin-[acetyl-CoA-carboxylase] ligase BirA-like protein
MSKALIITDTPNLLNGMPNLSQKSQWQPIDCKDWKGTMKKTWLAIGGNPEATPKSLYGLEPWRQIMVLANSPISQVDGLREMLQSEYSPPSPFACLAFTGEGFHGNRGRSWQAIEGNLHLTVLFSPNLPAQELGIGLSIIPSLAVVDAFDHFEGLRKIAKIKWVNDVLLSGKKVSGVITSTLTKGKNVEHVIFGIGVNIAATPSLNPGKFVQEPTSLREIFPDTIITQQTFLPVLLPSLNKRYNQLIDKGSEPLLSDYISQSCVIGRRVEIWEELTDSTSSSKILGRGIIQNIMPDLSIQLNNQVEPIYRGRLIFVN